MNKITTVALVFLGLSIVGIFAFSFNSKALTSFNTPEESNENGKIISNSIATNGAISVIDNKELESLEESDNITVEDNNDTRTIYVRKSLLTTISAVPNYKVTNLKCDLPTSVTNNYPDPLDGQPNRVHVMQCFISDSNYAYVTQQHGNGVTTISRCAFNANNTVATYQDRMIITNAGHGSTLEVYTYQGDDYFLLGLKVQDGDDNHYSIQIGAVQYSASETAINYDSIKRFSNLSYANTAGCNVSFGDIKSVKAAISPNKSTICFAVRNICNQMRYSYYDFDFLMGYLKYGTMQTSFKNNTTIQSHGKSTLTPNTAIIPASYQQGIDIYNDTNGNPSFTVVGIQNTGSNGNYVVPQLLFFDSMDTTVTKTVNVSPTYTEFGNPEMEGVHVNSYANLNIGAVAFDKVNNNNKIAFTYNVSTYPV